MNPGWVKGPAPCGFASLVFRCFPNARKMIFASARSCPLTLALSPNTKNVLGEREQMAGLVTQGAASGSYRWGALGYRLTPLLGLYKEEAASCRFTNVQSPE